MTTPTTAAGRNLAEGIADVCDRHPTATRRIVTIEAEARADLLDRLAAGVNGLEFASGWVTWSDDLAPTADKFVRRSAVLALLEASRE